ncbi:proton-conducting transporter membrane subunit [Filomicrobium sp.]|uniref:complex I subunit 5 family protein n=1 Tax=Filomicrobium sp. TaxID=2024831 RepID=UPI00258AC2B8|nr:proton-conducting transporter membrane subunit [Filomicrobium sp.]MCV0370155.1 hypothetical protein [Filomicrobium sp.]
MTLGEVLLVATLAVPLVTLVLALSSGSHRRTTILLVLAAIPALLTALFAESGTTVVLPQALLSLVLSLDLPGRLLLGAAALLWIATGAYAVLSRRGRENDNPFPIWWLATMTGSFGVFIVADLVGFYLFFTLVSLSAYWLVVDDGAPPAKRAGAVYVSFALLSEAFLLLAFVLLAVATRNDSFLIRDAVAAISTSPLRDPAMAFLVLGFGIKIGLVPFHVWMPLTYASASIPVAAVLSGATVKAGVIGLIRFLPFGVPLPGWGETLTALGFVSAFYGVLIGITQTNPRTILAYSSVSQMGLIAAVLGMGLATGNSITPAAAAFYAMFHILAKGGLFLAIGVAQKTRHRTEWTVLLPAAVVVLGFGGFPMTGGAIAKYAIKSPLGDGDVAMLAMVSAAASTLLMLHFLRCLRASRSHETRTTSAAEQSFIWLAIAVAVVALPWALYPAVIQASAHDALSFDALWKATWPVLIGVLLFGVLGRAPRILPMIPPGDIIVLHSWAWSGAKALGDATERIDEYLRRWSIAGSLLLVVTLALIGSFYVGR